MTRKTLVRFVRYLAAVGAVLWLLALVFGLVDAVRIVSVAAGTPVVLMSAMTIWYYLRARPGPHAAKLDHVVPVSASYLVSITMNLNWTIAQHLERQRVLSPYAPFVILVNVVGLFGLYLILTSERDLYRERKR